MPLVPHVSSGQIVASTWGNLVADHTIMRFTTAAQRSSQLPAPILNQLSSLDTASGVVDYWNGTAWLPAGPGAELAYTQTTATVSVSAITAASAVLAVDGIARTYDGQPVIVEFYIPGLLSTSPAANTTRIVLWDDTTPLGDLGVVNLSAGQLNAAYTMKTRITPTAGTHKFLARSWVSAGTSSLLGGAGTATALVPMYLRVTRV